VFVDLMQKKIKTYFEQGISLYKYMLDNGVAKECARFVLPQATQTRLYMSGSIRSWIHYIDLRSAHGTQAEHKEIAEKCKCIFVDEFPTIASALDWACKEPPSLLF
jgi:thymidylate synthase (FAD)